MYIHLGETVSVLSSSVIMILDLTNDPHNFPKDTQTFLKHFKDKKQTVYVSSPPYKSCVICKSKNSITCYYSAISSKTLTARSGSGQESRTIGGAKGAAEDKSKKGSVLKS